MGCRRHARGLRPVPWREGLPPAPAARPSTPPHHRRRRPVHHRCHRLTLQSIRRPPGTSTVNGSSSSNSATGSPSPQPPDHRHPTAHPSGLRPDPLARPQARANTGPTSCQRVGLGGIEPPTSALSALVSSLAAVALTCGFVVPNLCCCPGVPHTCQIGRVKWGSPRAAGVGQQRLPTGSRRAIREGVP